MNKNPVANKDNNYDTDEVETRVHTALLPKNINWAVLKNIGVQVIARIIITVFRYLGNFLIFRFWGGERFGQYSLILIILSFGETILDFGLNEIFVREVHQHPYRKQSLLSALTYSKMLQIIVAYIVIVGLLVLSGYSKEVVYAGLIGGLELVFFGGIFIYKGLFKAMLKIQCDMIAELVSTVVFFGLLVEVCYFGGGLSVIFIAFVCSRMVYFLVAFALGRRDYNLYIERWNTVDIRKGFIAALPIGISMFMVSIYTSLDIFMLSWMDSWKSVGLYSAAYRFMLPLVLIPTALMTTLYPILSSYWGHRMDDLRKLYQQGMDCSILLAGATFCGVVAGAGFLMNLFGPEAVEATPALRILALTITIMHLSAIIGPMFIIIRQQWFSLAFGMGGVIINATLNILLIPRFSYIGAAVATCMREITLVILALFVIQHFIGYHLKWWILVKVVISVTISLVVIQHIRLFDTVWGGLLAVLFYGIGIIVTGAIQPRQIQTFIRSVREKS
ncbi:MAG: flippase [bacterium]